MFSRRKFLSRSALGSMSLAIGTSCNAKENSSSTSDVGNFTPKVIATWKPNIKATEAAWKIIEQGGKAIDAVEQGVRVPEADPEDMSVGYGGRPDRDGKVTLDSCIMDENGNCGSVCFLQNIKHPISVARKVMDKTPHVILAGEGALQFALSEGFEKEDLMTEKSTQEWQEWLKEKKYEPIINIENHDTIGMLALDKNGNLSGACTTSGLAYKMHGRVGDSPIIGAGLFVDNEIGAATATGMGEFVLKTLGSFLVVELMRQGRTPQEACEEAVMRIVKKQKYQDFQIGYLAMNKKGEVGSYCIHPGFNYAQHQNKKGEIFNSDSYVKK
ncbi:MAG: isoaspartyl peptidase/L-asparaginase family protein [Saprospiraceae bacterium]